MTHRDAEPFGHRTNHSSRSPSRVRVLMRVDMRRRLPTQRVETIELVRDLPLDRDGIVRVHHVIDRLPSIPGLPELSKVNMETD